MALLDKSTFDTTYFDPSGTFADNTTRLITEGNLRQFSKDISDSVLFIQDTSAAFSKSTSITQSQMLTGNTAPISCVPAQGIGLIIVPIAFIVNIQYGSAAFLTNTTFRFEINNVAVSATNTTIMTSVANRTAIVAPSALDTTTDLTNQPLVLEVQGGNPTFGTGSIIFVTVVYSTLNVA